MFKLQRLHFGTKVPLLNVYVDSLNTLYAYDNVIVEAEMSNDVLDVTGVTASVLFNGDPFPLQGSDYSSQITGTLHVTVTSTLSPGLHRVPFVSTTPIFPIAGIAVAGMGVSGLTGDISIPLRTVLQIQVLSLPSFLNQSTGGRPTAWGGTY